MCDNDQEEEIDVQCTICLDEPDEPLTDFTELACGHRFHSKCIAKWLWQKKGAMSCPLCLARPQPDADTDSLSSEISETLSEYAQRILDEREDNEQRKEDQRRMHNIMRRKFKSRNLCNAQKRFRDLGERIAQCNKEVHELRKTINNNKRKCAKQAKDLFVEWKRNRRSIYDAEKNAEQYISSVRGPLFHRSDIGTKKVVDKKIIRMKELRC